MEKLELEITSGDIFITGKIFFFPDKVKNISKTFVGW